MSKVKIVALDLDDTLLKKDLSISDHTISVLQKLIKKGVYVILASGRAFEAMTSYARMIGTDKVQSYIISNNGSEILASDTHEMFSHYLLPADIAIEAFNLSNDANLSCHVYKKDAIYVSKETPYSARDHHLSGLNIIVPDDYKKILQNGVRKLVIPGEPEFIIPIEAEFKVHFTNRATVFVSKPYFIEIMPLHSGKGEALKEVADHLGIKKEHVMAFGDSMNDESMIRYAGESVAMKNGRDEIKKLARHMSYKTNDEDGVADFLEKHLDLF